MSSGMLRCDISCRFIIIIIIILDKGPLNECVNECVVIIEHRRPSICCSRHGLYSDLAVAAVHFNLKPVDCCVLNPTRSPLILEPDQGCGRTAAARQGMVWSWSAGDWHCNQGIVQATTSLHCSWRRTFHACSFNFTGICWNESD